MRIRTPLWHRHQSLREAAGRLIVQLDQAEAEARALRRQLYAKDIEAKSPFPLLSGEEIIGVLHLGKRNAGVSHTKPAEDPGAF